VFHLKLARHPGLWLLLVLLGVTRLEAADSAPSFAEWRAACAKLPQNRILGGRMPPKALLPLQEFGELDRVLDAYFALATNGPLSQPARWLGSPPKLATFLDVSRTWFSAPTIPFEPFAGKLVLPQPAKVVLQGDLHGDIHSLLGVLGRWQERRWLDGFTITDPSLHVIFLGDYTDRGVYGIEVIYTLMRLKLANPDRVHLIRGNHEDVNLVARYGFLAEGRAKYGSAFRPEKLLRAYDFLPAVLYLGCGTDFVQLCHGGMEPGFSPTALLSSEGTNRFQLLGPLRQTEFLKNHPGLLSVPAEASVARRQFQDFVPTAPTTPGVIGFMWNDFTVFSDEPAFAHNPDRAFVYGQPAVRYLLGSAATGETRLHAVIRAHQHSGLPNPLMRRLIASQGLFRHWQETNSLAAQNHEGPSLTRQLETQATRPIPEGSVWTLNVGPDSVYGLGCGFGFATFSVVTLGERFEDWRITVDTVDIPTKP
jgi:hypothetical protein